MWVFFIILRHINPAAFIEKTPDQSETSSINDESKLQPPSENQSDIVPPLDLQSEDNYPTTRDYTFSYRKHCEAAKIVLKPDLAYETWLSAKRSRYLYTKENLFYLVFYLLTFW